MSRVMISSVVNVPRWLVVAGAVVLAAAVGVSVYSYQGAGKWKADAAAWLARAADSDTLRAQDSLVIERVREGLATTQTELDAALVMNRRLAIEAAELRRQRRALVVTSSVPGQAPSVGDTLATCRQGLTLCEQEAAKEKLRADSLADVTQGATMVASSLRGDVEHWKQAYGSLQGMVADARPLIANADPPCWLVRFGPIQAHCPGRKTVAAWAAGGTLLAIGAIDGNREMKIGGLALITIGIVW